MNELKMFENSEFGQVRALEIDGEAWLIGRDIAYALGYAETANMRKLLDDDEYREIDPQKPEFTGFVQNGVSPSTHRMLLVNESGLYTAIFGSTLPKAKEFRHWVTSVVLPSIRKNGGYIAGQEVLSPEEFVSKALEVAYKILENKDRKIEEMKPKADFFDAVTDSKTAISIGEVAKILDMGIGRNKLFEILRDEGILMSDNQPYQKYVDAGYFRVIEQKYVDGCGETRINIKTLVFQSGVNYIRRRIEKRLAPKCQGQA